MLRRIKKRLVLPGALALLVIVLGSAALACSSRPATSGTETPTTSVPSGRRVTLLGAGSTFAYPLYSAMFPAYAKVSNVDVNYQPIGSGAGIQQLTAKTIDFGASDAIMTDAQLAAAPGPILHIPMASGATAISYNLPASALPSGTPLKLTPDVLADMYLGKITKWNDPRIVALNPGSSMPLLDITTVHRSDGSGTTFIFTNYLSKVSQQWAMQVGNATTVSWPVGIGGPGNPGVAGLVTQTSGAIGYVELAYVIQNKMASALIQNSSGNFVAPTLDSTVAAATGVLLPTDMKVMITNSPNPSAYPICGFTWILIYQRQTDPVKGPALVNMLWWATHDGQQYTTPLDYAKLSPDAVTNVEAELRSVTLNGQPLLK